MSTTDTTPSTEQAHTIGPVGRTVRVLLGITFLGGVLALAPRHSTTTLLAAVGGTAALVVTYLVIHVAVARRLRGLHPLAGTTLAIGPGVLVFLLGGPVGRIGALVFWGVSLVVAGVRAAPGCEVMVVPGLILGRHVPLPCAVLTPLDWLERRLRTGSATCYALVHLAVAVLLVVATVPADVTGDASPTTTPRGPSDAELRTAINETRSALLARQRNDHWASNITSGRNDVVDVRLTLYYALMLEVVDAEPESQRAAIRWVLSRRSEDGGWNDTVANYAALLLFERMNTDRYGDVAADVRAANGRNDRSLVPARSGEGFTHTYRLRLLYALLSDRYSARELFPRGRPAALARLAELTPAFQDGIDPEESFTRPSTSGMVLTMMLLGLQAERTAGWEGEQAENAAMLTEGGWEIDNRSRAVRQVERLLLERRDPKGLWVAGWGNVFAVLALSAVGYDADDPEVRRAIAFLAGERQAPSGRMMSYKLPVWETSWAVHALATSGLPRENASLSAATGWLYRARTAPPAEKQGEFPLERLPVPFRAHAGDGWGSRPHVVSDWDDTAVAMVALAPTDRLDPADVAFLFAVQNADGGWGAYATDFEPLSKIEHVVVVNRTSSRFYRYLFYSESGADVTGHALLAFGRLGYTVENNRSVRRAVEYLLDARTDDGLWVGDWGKGYAYGTSRALLGMSAVGVDMDRRAVRVAVSELVERQNTDGGWGWSRSDPASRPTATAWAVQGLLAAGVSPSHPALQRAVNYLLATRQPDGSWESGLIMRNRGGFEYSLPLFAQASILLALASYEQAPDRPPQQYDPGQRPFRSWGPVAGGSVLVAAAVAYVVYRRRRRQLTAPGTSTEHTDTSKP